MTINKCEMCWILLYYLVYCFNHHIFRLHNIFSQSSYNFETFLSTTGATVPWFYNSELSWSDNFNIENGMKSTTVEVEVVMSWVVTKSDRVEAYCNTRLKRFEHFKEQSWINYPLLYYSLYSANRHLTLVKNNVT